MFYDLRPLDDPSIVLCFFFPSSACVGTLRRESSLLDTRGWPSTNFYMHI